MAVTLPLSLATHQRGLRKRPALTVTNTPTRFGIPILRFSPLAPDAEPSAPVAAVTDADGDLYLARNNAGALDLNVNNSGWSNLDTVTTGQGFALAYDPLAGHVLLAYADGNDLKLRTSADGFATPTTLLTEASPIGAVALAVRASNGNACAFYTLGTSTTLKRLRRTSGTWAASGTTWTRSADVASLTGLAAVHSGNFYLAITGTAATTTDEKLWAVAMGDGPLPSNAWSALVTIAEADAAASLTFAYPSLAYVRGVLFCAFWQAEAGNAPAARTMLTSTTASANPLAHWTEPFPTTQLATSHGAALAYTAPGPAEEIAHLAAPAQLATWLPPADFDLSPCVLSCSWRETPTSLRLRLDLDALGPLPAAFLTAPVGSDLYLAHGFHSDTDNPATIENGITLRANIARVTRRFVPGKATVTVEADGPWETLSRYRAPQAWTAPAGHTRAQIFSRVAGRAGVEMTEASGPRAPSTAWSTDTPGFAVAAGERASTTLQRLLTPTTDFTRISGADGAVQICGGFSESDDPDVDELWALPHDPQDDHPLFELAVIDEHQLNWIRLQGDARYADAFHYDGLLGVAPHLAPAWPIMDHLRDLSATTNAAASEAAFAALLRAQSLTPYAELTAPVNVATELFDVINVEVDSPGETTYELDPGIGRIIARGVDYKRGPAGAAYNSVLTLGRVRYPEL